MNKLLAGLLFAGGLFLTGGAEAAQSILCAPQLADTAAARTIGGTASQIPSGSTYTLNGQGCTLVKQQDIGWFLSQGFSAGPPFGPNIIFSVPVTATGTTSYAIGVIPAGAYLQHVIVQNTDATHAVTGGITMGSTAGGTDIIGTALAIPVSSLVYETDALILKRVFSSTAQTTVYAQAVTSWNTPTTVTFTLVYGYF